MIYMDHHATTPLRPEILERMLPYFTEHFGNASSAGHAFGWRAEKAVSTARKQVAELLGCHPQEVIFTSGATESNNLALFGVTEANQSQGGHLITQATEHPAVLEVIHVLAERGYAVTTLDVDRRGHIDLDMLRSAIRDDTILVSIMHANNEIGTIHPVEEIGSICREHNVLFHVDAAQTAGCIPIDLARIPIDLLSISAHKMYGPKGAGALFKRRKNPRVKLHPQIVGGGHESGLRAGTLNVPGVVGLGYAAEYALENQQQDKYTKVAALRDGLQERIASTLNNAGIKLYVQGDVKNRLPGNLNFYVEGANADSVVLHMRDVAISSGSACASAQQKASHVLSAVGLSVEQARCSFRFGLGLGTTSEMSQAVAESFVQAVLKTVHQNSNFESSLRILRE